MRIGSDDTFFLMERVGQDGSTVTWRVAAAAGGPGWWAAAMHERVTLDGPAETATQGADFATGAIHRLELRLQEGGSLRVERRPNGCILLRYRLGPVTDGAALEGEVGIESESADAFCRQLADLVRLR